MLRLLRAGPVALCCLLAACEWAGPKPAGAVGVSAADNTLDAFDATTQLTAMAVNHLGQTVPFTTFHWTSSDPSIASVNSAGLVTAHGNGTAIITATSGRGWPGTTEIVVDQIAVAMVVQPDGWQGSEAWIGARRQFSATATDANGHPIDDIDVTWTSSNELIVQVDDAGLATAVGAGGLTLTAQVDAAQELVDVSIPVDLRDIAGPMYTLWFARSDSAPAVLVNGRIEVPNGVHFLTFYEDPRSPWPHTLPGQTITRNTIHKFQWLGDRIGLLTDMANGSGTFRAIDRIGEWTNLVIATATDFQLEGNRIAVTEQGGLLRIKSGIGGHNWSVVMSEGVADFQLEGNLIGALRDDGSLHVGIDPDLPLLMVEGAGVVAFQLEGSRIGQLREDGSFRVKDGAGPWTDVAVEVVSFRLGGNRIAVLHEDGRLRAKDGLGGAWVDLNSGPVRQYELQGSPSRIGVLYESGAFEARAVLGNAPTELAAAGVREFQFQGSRIGLLLDTGRLKIHSGISNDFVQTPEYGPGVTQFRPIVDVPVHPFRTTPGYYSFKQDQCINYVDPDDDGNGTVNNCYWEWRFDLPVSNYGFFCGGGRPFEFQQIIRDPAFLIDSLDAVCRHHDVIDSWYPEAGGFGSGDWTGACIVRYGMYYGRLTSSGGPMTDGAEGAADDDGWHAAWSLARMDNLKAALDRYFGHTSGCSDDVNLPDFAAATASQN